MGYTHEQIAELAYIYWEVREKNGLPGNDKSDWASVEYRLLHYTYEEVRNTILGIGQPDW